MVDDYERGFLSEGYVKHGLLRRQLTDEESAVQKALQIQQRVYENCLVRASLVGISSAFVGSLVGAFFFSVHVSNTAHNLDIAETRTLRSQLYAQYRQCVPAIKSSARNFAKIGFLFSLFECCIQKYRAKSDLRNSLYSGCSTGAVLGMKSGPIASAGGCIGFAAFSGLIDMYQQSHR